MLRLESMIDLLNGKDHPMLIGAHAVLYSSDPLADRAFLRDVFRLPNVDAGHGWLIFGLPPAEVAVHPADANGRHELYFMCADVEAFGRAMEKAGIACSAIREERWGRLVHIKLPGGGELGVYEPRHPRPKAAAKSRSQPKRRSTRAPLKRPSASKARRRQSEPR